MVEQVFTTFRPLIGCKNAVKKGNEITKIQWTYI